MLIPSEKVWNRLWVVAGVMLVLVLLSSGVLRESPFPLIGLGVVCAFVVFLIVAGFISARHWPRPDPNEGVKRLEAQGLLSSSDFRAARAFQVEETADLGPHYFIELEDGSVLHLNGQYLYDYEPINDDPEVNQPRLFPCTDFTIRRHRTKRYVVEITCRGEVLEPEIVAPPFESREFRERLVPEDGLIITEQSYDDLKHARLAVVRKTRR